MSTYARLYMSLTVNKGSKHVAGNVLDRAYEQEIEVEDWEWKLTRPELNEGESDGKSTMASEFSFTKVMDQASTQMLSLLATGEELSAVVTLVQTTDNPFKLVAYLENVRITGYTINAKDQEKSTSIEESWVFQYENITLEHEPEPGKNKATQTFATKHERTQKDNAQNSVNLVKSVVDDFIKLKMPDQDKALRQLNDIRKATGT